MKEDEIKKLKDEFEKRSQKLFELYKQHPSRDGHIKEDLELRRWYESELKRIYKEQ